MAITGAFQAGLIEGFGEAFEESTEQRRETYEKHLDNQLTRARSVAPAFSKSTAQLQQQMELMNTFNTEFGINDAEYVALAEKYDINDLYSTFAAHKASLPENVQLRKEDLLSVLNIKKGDVLELPEGVTAEMALRRAVLGYANNMAQNPEDKSEGKKMKSWAQAIGETLMTNPRARAEDAIKQMQVMGIPVEDLLLYQAAQMDGTPYQTFPGVSRATGTLGELKHDYKVATDYEAAQSKYRAELTRNFSNGQFDDITDVPDSALGTMASLLKVEDATDDKAKQRAALGQTMAKGGKQFAELELQLLKKGYYNGFNTNDNRASALLAISSEINTPEELRKFSEAVKSGALADMIIKEGAVTEELLDTLFGDGQEEVGLTMPEAKVDTSSLDGVMDASGMEMNEQMELILEPPAAQEGATQEPAAEEPTLQNEALVNNIVETEPEAKPEDTTKSVQERNEETKQSFIEAAKNYTFEEYQDMSRQEKRDAGLPSRPIDYRFAYGYMNPQQYFKGYVEPKSEKPMSSTEFIISKSGQDLLTYLREEEELTGADSMDDVLGAVAAWFGDQGANLNLGSDIDARNVARIMYLTLKRLDEQQ